MGKQLVPHGLDQGFGSGGVVHPEDVLAGHLEYRHHQNGDRHDPQVLPKVSEASDGIHRVHNEGGIIRFLAAQGAVHRCSNDLGLQHIRQCRHTGSQYGHEEVPFRPVQELPQKREFFPVLRTFFIG